MKRYCSYCDAEAEHPGGLCEVCGNRTAAGGMGITREIDAALNRALMASTKHVKMIAPAPDSAGEVGK